MICLVRSLYSFGSNDTGHFRDIKVTDRYQAFQRVTVTCVPDGYIGCLRVELLGVLNIYLKF